MLDNQKFCPKYGLPVDSKMLENTSKEIISDSEKQKSQKQESEKQSNLNISDNKKKKHINKSIIIITMDNIAKSMFSDMLDYAISPYLECEIEGIELYLVRVNEGEPDYEVNEFLLGSVYIFFSIRRFIAFPWGII